MICAECCGIRVCENCSSRLGGEVQTESYFSRLNEKTAIPSLAQEEDVIEEFLFSVLFGYLAVVGKSFSATLVPCESEKCREVDEITFETILEVILKSYRVTHEDYEKLKTYELLLKGKKIRILECEKRK